MQQKETLYDEGDIIDSDIIVAKKEYDDKNRTNPLNTNDYGGI